MANPITPKMKTGTIGELLVQLRLLQYDIQAAPPIKDSGNDLIAVKGWVFKTIQVKTSAQGKFKLRGLKRKKYHILALVNLNGENRMLYLDKSKIFLIPKKEVNDKASYTLYELENMDIELTSSRLNKLFKGNSGDSIPHGIRCNPRHTTG